MSGFTRKEIYKLFAERGLYLPKYQLDLIEADFKNRINKGEAVFSVIYSYEKRDDFNHFVDKAKGQYVLEKSDIERPRRPVIMIDDDGTETYFDSVYSAAKKLGLTKNSCGNITNAANGKTAVSYKKKWKWAI